MKLLNLIPILTLSLAVSCANHSSYHVGPGTEDLVLHQEEEALYTRTTHPPQPLFDKLFAGSDPQPNVWRLQLKDGQIVDQQPVLDRSPARLIKSKTTGATLTQFDYQPLALYLHPQTAPTHLYVLNKSKSMPGFLIVPLQDRTSAIEFVSADSHKKEFAAANSLAVHPDGTVFVSLFKPQKSLSSPNPLLIGGELSGRDFLSVLAINPESSTAGWRTAIGNLPGANGMAFHSSASGKVDLYLSDHTGKAILKLDASNSQSLANTTRTKLGFHPDNLNIEGDTLIIAGQHGLAAPLLNVILSSSWPVVSDILTWNLNEIGAQPVRTKLQPPIGRAVATAIPYGDVIYCSHITGSTIRTLYPRDSGRKNQNQR